MIWSGRWPPAAEGVPGARCRCARAIVHGMRLMAGDRESVGRGTGPGYAPGVERPGEARGRGSDAGPIRIGACTGKVGQAEGGSPPG